MASSAEFNFACSLANPFIRQEVRELCKGVRWKSEIAKEVVDYFMMENQPLFPSAGDIRLYFANRHRIQEEVDKIIVACNDALLIKDRIHAAVDEFVKFYHFQIVTDAFTDYRQDGNSESLIDKIKSIKYAQTSRIPLLGMAGLNVKQVMRKELGSGPPYPTVLSCVRQSTPYQGYQRGEVVEFCGPPSSGKSLLMLNEVIEMLKMGAYVHWLALGDMTVLDFIIRSSSIILAEPYIKVLQDPEHYYQSEAVQHILKDFKVSQVPASTVNINSVLEFIETKVTNGRMLDAFVLDYDANLQRTNGSMYEDAEITFNALNKISRPEDDKPYRLVFVGSQPKVMYWDAEELPKEAPAESSRKQAIVDKLVTLGRAHSDFHHCGIIKLAKSRRGREGLTMKYQVSHCGRFEEVEDSVYPTLKSYSSNDSYQKKAFKSGGGRY